MLLLIGVGTLIRILASQGFSLSLGLLELRHVAQPSLVYLDVRLVRNWDGVLWLVLLYVCR